MVFFSHETDHSVRNAKKRWTLDYNLNPNLIRYQPSGVYFGRVRVNGKLIRRSLDTHVLTVAKLKLSDFLQDHRRLAVNKGQSVTGEIITGIFRQEIENDHNNNPRTKLYKQEILIALKKSWPELYTTDIARISQNDCSEWAARCGRDYSATRFNGAFGIVRRVFDIAVEQGYRVDNPAKFVDLVVRHVRLVHPEFAHKNAVNAARMGAWPREQMPSFGTRLPMENSPPGIHAMPAGALVGVGLALGIVGRNVSTATKLVCVSERKRREQPSTGGRNGGRFPLRRRNVFMRWQKPCR